MKESCSKQADYKSASSGQSHLRLISGTSNSSEQFDTSANFLQGGGRSQALLEENLLTFKKKDIEQENRERQSRFNTRRELNYVHDVFERNHFYDIKENTNGDWKYKNYYVWKNRTGYCHRRQFDSSQSTSLYSNGKIDNMFKCGTAQCVSCSKGYFCQKHKDIQKVLTHHKDLGRHFYMATLTVSHNKTDSLADVTQLSSSCKTKLMKHKVIKDLNDKLTIARKEETWNERNGWHVHYHILLAYEEQLTDVMIDNMKKQWIKICKSFGNNVTYENGLDVKHLSRGVEEAVSYICKDGVCTGSYEEGGTEGIVCTGQNTAIKKAAFEISSVNTKQGRGESYTVHELISLAAAGKWNEIYVSERKVEDVILEYYSVKNKKVFTFSKSYHNCLKELSGEENEGSGEQEISRDGKRIDIQSKVVYQLIESKLWNKILMINVKHADINDMLGEIWNVIEASDFEERYGYVKEKFGSINNFITIVDSSAKDNLRFRRTLYFRQGDRLLAA